ncbi:MAG: hypothetical protein ACK53Y_12345, partial [bacterium]
MNRSTPGDASGTSNANAAVRTSVMGSGPAFTATAPGLVMSTYSLNCVAACAFPARSTARVYTTTSASAMPTETMATATPVPRSTAPPGVMTEFQR